MRRRACCGVITRWRSPAPTCCTGCSGPGTRSWRCRTPRPGRPSWGCATSWRSAPADPEVACGGPIVRDRPLMDPSREIITHEAALLAAVDGLDRLSVGRLAAALGLSKSEVSAHFGSKQDLQ